MPVCQGNVGGSTCNSTETCVSVLLVGGMPTRARPRPHAAHSRPRPHAATRVHALPQSRGTGRCGIQGDGEYSDISTRREHHDPLRHRGGGPDDDVSSHAVQNRLRIDHAGISTLCPPTGGSRWRHQQSKRGASPKLLRRAYIYMGMAHAQPVCAQVRVGAKLATQRVLKSTPPA